MLRLGEDGTPLLWPDDDRPMLLQGGSMEVTRLPLPDDLIRLKALQAAVEIGTKMGYSEGFVLRMAQKFENYIRDGSVQ